VGYITRTLLSDEKILYYTRPHVVVFSQSILWFLFAVLLFCFGSVYRMLSVLALVMSLLDGFIAFIGFFFSEYAITNKRIVMKAGFISRKSLEIFLNRIESIYVEQNIFGSFFGYGTVVICGIGGSKDSFRYIPDPILFRKRSQEELEKASKII
jgi:uncharacterized membrane protein YdbT with pleckstrin-like domain